jgi:hypothetical protein
VNRIHFLRGICPVFWGLLLTCIGCTAVRGQQNFVEGQISYQVLLTFADGRTDSGSFSITVKENQLKKEFSVPGHSHITLVNTTAGTAFVLLQAKNKKFVVEIKVADLEKEQKPFENFIVEQIPGTDTPIASLNAKKAIVKYRNGSSHPLFISEQWAFNIPYVFERFPKIKYLPVDFEYRENKVLLHFQLQKIDLDNIENSVFQIPADYVLITNAEYENTRRR